MVLRNPSAINALKFAERELQEVAFHDDYASQNDKRLAEAVLIMLSSLRSHLTDHEHEK